MKIKNTWLTLGAIGVIPIACVQAEPPHTRKPTTLGGAAEKAEASEAINTNIRRDQVRPPHTRDPQTLGRGMRMRSPASPARRTIRQSAGRPPIRRS